jgi:hypothetical protein
MDPAITSRLIYSGHPALKTLIALPSYIANRIEQQVNNYTTVIASPLSPTRYLLTLCSFLLLMSCEADSPTDTSRSFYKSKTVRTESERKQVEREAGRIDAELKYYRATYHRATQWVTNSVQTDAVFADDTVGVDVDSVLVYDTPLIRSMKGRYGSFDSAQYRTSSLMYWTVEGYDGGYIRDTAENVKELEIRSYIVGDTIFLSQGLNVSYDGADGGEITVRLIFSYAHTWAWGDTTVADDPKSGGFIEKVVLDNGLITFTPDELKGLTTNAYYMLTLSHWAYHITSASNGRRVAVFRSHDVSMPLILQP